MNLLLNVLWNCQLGAGMVATMPHPEMPQKQASDSDSPCAHAHAQASTGERGYH